MRAPLRCVVDALYYAWCRACWWAVILIPVHWRGRAWRRITWLLLPCAGEYAYTEGGFAGFRAHRARRRAWIAAGRPQRFCYWLDEADDV